MPKISFIVPVYGVEKYIHQCVDSILGQTFKDFELILVDDGSPDNCPVICDEYAQKDSRVKVIHKKNAGVSAARNTGIEASGGEWVYFVDSDDWLELDAAATLYNDAIENDADCVMSDCVKCYENGKTVRIYQFSQAFFTDSLEKISNIQKYMLCHKYSPYYSPNTSNGYAAPWGKFVKMSILKDNNIRFDPYAKGVFDDGIYSLYVLDHVKRFYFNRKHTYNYRMVGNSITHKFKENAMEIMKLNYELVDKFIKDTQKDESFIQAEACRRVSFFASYLSKYYFNPQSTLSVSEVRKKLLEDLSTWPYKEAFTVAKASNLEPKHRYILYCGKYKFYLGLKLYADLRRIAKVSD